ITDDTIDLMLFLEISVATSFVLVGLIFGRGNTAMQIIILITVSAMITTLFYFKFIPDGIVIAMLVASFFYIFWISIITFSTFSLFRDLFSNEIFGTVLFLGKPTDDGKAMFSLFGIVLALINGFLGYFIFINSGDSQSLKYTALIIIATAFIATLPLVGLQQKYDVFVTILNWFYMFSTIKIILLAFKVLSGTSGSTSFWDTIFSLFMALYAIQGATVKGIKLGRDDPKDEKDKKEKKQSSADDDETEFQTIVFWLRRILSDRGIVLVILGIVLGYHTMQVQTIQNRENIFNKFVFTKDADIIILGYQVSLAITLFIILVSILLFILLPSFRNYGNPEVKRIPWAPPYEDLKLMVNGIRTGEISWKADVFSLMAGIGMDKVKGKFGRKNPDQDRLTGTINRWLSKVKNKEKNEED
ncbi:MAG: hypothetical protein OEY49_18510, partial [Candidatus Heimdallarchaeota archaeon]|nr:hypothetical protein [Candidatus Heimdallarchaeota archaeon]